MPKGTKNPLCFGLGERLKTMRNEAGLSFFRLSRLAGCANGVPNAIERANRLPTIDIVEKIARALGISPCWLAFGEQGPEVFQQKRPRPVLPPDPPAPTPGTAEQLRLHLGVGARLNQRRCELGWSARKVAGMAGVSVQAVLYTEASASVPKIDNVERLALALGVAPCWLAFGTEPEGE